MEFLYHIQTPLTGMAIVGIILYNVLEQTGRKDRNQSLFIAMLVTTFFLLLLEMLVDLLSGNSLVGGYFLISFVAAVFYILNPLPGALYVLYMHNLLYPQVRIHKGVLAATWIPVAFNALLSITSTSSGMAFYIDSANIYHRGPYFFLMAISGFIYFIAGIIFLILNRKTIRRQELSSLLFFPIPVIAGAIAQSLVYGLSVLWLSLSFSILMVYLKIQNSQVSKDYLTGLFNRRRFDRYLEFMLTDTHSKASLGGIVMDIDAFKKINDTYGHDLGDRALRSIADVLRMSVRRKHLISRVGGDEFAILLEVKGIDDLEKVVKRIHENLEMFNTFQSLPFTLSLSMGYGICEDRSAEGAKKFLKVLDERMYVDKLSFRNLAPDSQINTIQV